MSEHKEPIPSMIYNAAVGGHVTNSQQIIDENLNKEQSQINQETDTFIKSKGNANGVASLNNAGKVPESQLPDNIIEGYYYGTEDPDTHEIVYNFYTDIEHTQKITPSSDKIYFDKPTNVGYHWTGSEYSPVGNPDVYTKNEIDNMIDDTLHLSEQTLTNTQQEQVRDNIGLDGVINAAVASEASQRQAADSSLQNSITSETSRAQATEQLLQEQYSALTQSDIIVGTLQSSGTKNKIYRVPGTNTYSDYMWNGSSFVKMATYDNAIDDLPTGNSDNLVKSGGVFKLLFNKFIKGADMTYVEVPTYGLVPNHTYYLFIKDMNWTLPSDMIDDVNKLAIDSVYNGEKTNFYEFHRYDYIPNPIPFTIPRNSDYILVGGRAAIGTNIEFYISDINPQDIVTANAPIPLNIMLGYNMNLLFSVTSGYGDAACYNNLIFQFIDGNQYVYVHDASNGTLIQTITMPNPNSGYHNNSVSFGSEKYDVNDTYPLLYASQENSAQNKCIVYRITGSQGSYEMTVVQTITYPTNAESGMNYHNCYIDTKNNYLLLSGLINYPYSGMDDNTLQYMAFELPTLSVGDITLHISDMLFKSKQFTKMPTTQGGFCKNGYLYQVFGVDGSKLLMVYDIKNCKYCYVYDLTEVYDNEPEGAFEYNNAIHIVFVGGRIYKFGMVGLL